MKKLTKMKNTEAKKFLLKSNSYCNIELPKYFNFQPLLEKVTKQNRNNQKYLYWYSRKLWTRRSKKVEKYLKKVGIIGK